MPSAKHERSISIGAVSNSSFAIIQLGLQTLSVILIARIIGPEEYGVVTAALAIVAFSQIFSEIGLAQGLIRLKTIRNSEVSTAFFSSAVLSLFIFCVIFLSRKTIAESLKMPDLEDYLPIIAIGFVGRGLSAPFEALAYRRYRFRNIATADLYAVIIGYGLTALPFALFGGGGYSIIIGAVVQQLTRSLFIWRAGATRIRLEFSRPAFYKLLEFGSWFTLARLLNYFATQADTLIVGRQLGAAALGFYGRIFQILMAPTTALSQVLSNVLYPYFSRKQNDHKAIALGFEAAMRASLLATIPIAVGVSVFAEPLVISTFGKEWLGMIPPLQLLCLSLPFRAAYKASDPVFKALNAMRLRAFIQFLYALLIIAAAFIGAIFNLTVVAGLISLVIFLHFAISFFSTTRLLSQDISVAHVFRLIAGPARYCAVSLLVTELTSYLARYIFSHTALLTLTGLVAIAVTYALLISFPFITSGPQCGTDIVHLRSVIKSRLTRF